MEPPSGLSVTRNRQRGKSLGHCRASLSGFHATKVPSAALGGETGLWAVFQTHLSCRPRAGAVFRRSCWGVLRSEPVDTAQDVGEEVTWDGDLGHLERDVATVAYHLRTDLDEFFPEAGE